MNIANAVTSLRILLVPFLAYAAATRNETLFVGAFVLGGLTDVLDGFIARRFNLHSPWGSALDTIADMLFYPAGLLAAVFVPALARYWHIIIFVILAIGVAMAFAAIKGKFSTIHRWPSKMAAAGMFFFIIYTVAVEFSLVFFFVVAVLGIASALDRFISSRHT